LKDVPQPFDLGRIESIASRLELREPNKEALESIVFASTRHYEIDREPPPFEAVADIATGVGKTYVLASLVEYLAQDGVRNFAVIAPGRTILTKTVGNFTAGHPRSLLAGMEVRPIVITSDNFATPAMRAAMEQSDEVKLYVFTVQALLKPESKIGRKTHKFQEGLGAAFYAHLQGLTDLVVFADEHHTYYGPAFSTAIRELRPRMLIGLTATPHKKTPTDQIVYRYPLAAAIADRLVKTPVLVGRKDDRSDPQTKLLDGIRLLEVKDVAIRRWCAETGAEPISPVMLVVAPDIAEADEIAGILTSPDFAGGRYADKVLTVHSDAPDQALEALDALESPANPYRIVVSVGMLKEGWDVKNVYVIASMRASVSEILTEQTLGRGMRLPFGRYTGVEILDTLEVLGHERYEELLRKAGVLNEQFIDWRTRSVLKVDQTGQLVPVTEKIQVEAPLITAPVGGDSAASDVNQPMIRSVDDEIAAAAVQIASLHELPPRSVEPPLRIPRLKMTAIRSDFSLADIADLTPFQRLGEAIAADPVGALRRVTLGARIIEGPDGLRHTELVTSQAVDRVESPASLFPLDELRTQLISTLLSAAVVPARANQRRPAGKIVDAFIRGLGASAGTILSSYSDRAAAGLLQLVTEEQRKFTAKPSYGEVLELVEVAKTRVARPETSPDRLGGFKRGVGYEFRKSLYAQDWFDSSPERDVANVLEDENDIALWVRLQVGDLPILWSEGREYNPDFVAVDRSAVNWLVEVKMDKEMATPEVQGKRNAARRWANYVSADEKTGAEWRYLLLSETDLRAAKGSWAAMKGLGGL
jgi:type III restriction enzyme